jgi:hypothetical protein
MNFFEVFILNLIEAPRSQIKGQSPQFINNLYELVTLFLALSWQRGITGVQI